MKIFAVIGNPISHSKSPQIINAAMAQLKIKAIYTRILASSVEDFVDLNGVLELTGFNITAPFKKDIVRIVDGLDKDVAKLQVANTVSIDNTGRYRAYNTDVTGALESLKAKGSLEGKKVLVFGAGSAARAVVWGLLNEGCSVFLTNRSVEKSREIAAEFGVVTMSFLKVQDYISSMDIIVNTIPVAIPFFDTLQFNAEQIVLDAAYKTAPLRELAVEDGASYIEGEQWLINQARYAFKHFTNRLLSKEIFLNSLEQKSGKEIGYETRIALIGPMGAGKTTLGKSLAAGLGFEWLDLDDMIEKKDGISIGEYFQTKGEAEFRKLESDILLSCLTKGRIVISCGGGIVTEFSNRKLLKKYCQNIFLSVRAKESIRRIKDKKRPLLQDKNPVKRANEMIRERLPLYLEVADVVVNTNMSSPDDLKALIYEDYSQSFIL